MMSQNSRPVMRIVDVSKTFGSLFALSEVSLDVYPGEIIGIIGPNGAGKTTLLNLISGILSPTRGEIWFEGKEITRLKTYEVARLGIASTFQHFRLFNNMSGFHNALMGAWKLQQVGFLACMLGLPRAKKDDNKVLHKLLMPLAQLGILDKRVVPPPSTMTLRDQRALSIGRAIAGDPKVLLLDEPGAALNKEELEDMNRHFLRYKEQGLAIILIDHRMEILMGVSDRVVVLDFGRKIAEGTPMEIQADPVVGDIYFGKGFGHGKE